jgi:thiol-disulfide isomerase/thioredoxin
MDLVPKTVHAPEISAVWLQSAPLSLRELRGRVVLLDFFDYTCVNCLRTIPYLNDWHAKYASLGLTIIGIHSPEFYFARTPGHVERGIQSLGIQYPVVLDNEFQIWRAYANKVWPSKYLIDPDGYIRYYQVGEGGYADFEDAIRELLRRRDAALSLPRHTPLLQPTDDLATLASCRRPTAEVYCGTFRGRLANPNPVEEGQLAEFHFGNSPLEEGVLELDGWWGVGRECLEVAASPGSVSRMRLRFAAAEVNLVLMPPPSGTASLRVLLGDKANAVGTQGASMLEDERNGTTLSVIEPKMYSVIRSMSFLEGELTLECADAGLQIFAFTFGTCPRT